MSWIRKSSKALAWIVGGVLALAVMISMLVFVANLRDQPPSAAALRFAALYRDRPAVADAENGFIYASGFFAKPDEDPQAAGIQRIEWMRTKVRDPSPAFFTPPIGDFDYRSARTPSAQKISAACGDAGPDCLAAMENNRDALEEWSESEHWLFERYSTLIARPGWREIAPIDARMVLPPYGTILEGQKLLFVQAWRRAGEKDAASVRSLLSEDVRFWRHMLESSDMLISKMIAVAALKRHFELGNLVLRRLPPELVVAARPPEWQVEITRSERSMLRAWIGEWMILNGVVQESMKRGAPDSQDPNRLLRWADSAFLFQMQDFSNGVAEMFAQAAADLDVPYDRYRAAFARAEVTFGGSKQRPFPELHFYNPVGNILRWTAASAYAPYCARVADVEGMRRAALLITDLRSRGIDAAQVPAEVRSSAIRDPYTGEPFGWKAQNGTLTFTGLEPLPRGLHELIY